MEDSGALASRGEEPLIDLTSRWFRLGLTVLIVWVLTAAFLGWQSYADGRPSDVPAYDLSSYNCRDIKLDVDANNNFVHRQPTAVEVGECLDMGIRIERQSAARERQWARDAALEWFVIWGLAVPIALLGLIVVRHLIAVISRHFGRSYWGWVNAGERSR